MNALTAPLLRACALALFLVACGGKATPTAATPPEAPEAPEAPETEEAGEEAAEEAGEAEEAPVAQEPEAPTGEAPEGEEPGFVNEARADGSACLESSDCASGICEGEGCGDDTPGVCAPAGRACTRDLRPYCGCDGETFRTSGSCPGKRFAFRGMCEGDAGKPLPVVPDGG